MNVPLRGGVNRTTNEPSGSIIGASLRSMPLQLCTPS